MPQSTETVVQNLQEYRSVRRQLEESVLPVATSVDGRGFGFQASLHDLRLRRGGYVSLGLDAGPALGQVTDLQVTEATGSLAEMEVRVRMATGSGVLLAEPRGAFHDVPIGPAEPDAVATWLATARRSDRAGLEVGELLLAAGVPAVLDGGAFNRHTFMCGQSGSGKTYSLGVVLERILAETSLRVVVLDPNSDYVGLGHVRAGADPALARRYAEVRDDVVVWGSGTADRRLRLRFSDLDAAARAAMLGLDPVQDAEEYAVLTDLLAQRQEGQPLVTGLDAHLSSDHPGAAALARRASNLGVTDWSIWSPTLPSLVDEISAPTARCTVVDLGSLETMEEQHVASQAVLSALWRARRARQPCLVVIDEAHNVCPAEPGDLVTALTAERVVQIAAEGRKFGLFLLLSTQRPAKVHANVVSQCDNLLLMRMGSVADVAALGRLLSFVPDGLLASATTFRMGEALVAGRLHPHPTYVRMGGRVTEEGGADPPTTWALPRGRGPAAPGP